MLSKSCQKVLASQEMPRVESLGRRYRTRLHGENTPLFNVSARRGREIENVYFYVQRA